MSFSPKDLQSARHQLGKSRRNLSGTPGGAAERTSAPEMLLGERKIWKLQVELQSAHPNVRPGLVRVPDPSGGRRFMDVVMRDMPKQIRRGMYWYVLPLITNHEC